MLALALGAVALVGTFGIRPVSAAPSYTFEARDSGALSGRVFSALAPASDGAVVLYGGELADDSEGSMGDTWVHTDAAGWVARCGSPANGAPAACGPGPRSSGAMAAGPTGAVLFGGGPDGIDGDGGGVRPSDTWVWSGDAWQQVCGDGACGPGGRFFPAMGGNGEQVVLFGGLGAGVIFDDTWVFDGSTWTQTCGSGMPIACGPQGLAGATIGWDGTQFVLFGGSPFGEFGGEAPVDDTWTFDGAKWVQVCGASMTQPCGPAARSLAGAAYQHAEDAANRGMVMGGGGNLFADGSQTLRRDAWMWQAGAWTQLPTPWSATPVSWVDGSQPPAGSGPLIPLLAARPASCQVLMVAQNPEGTPEDFSLLAQTFAGGWDLDASGAPSGCTVDANGGATDPPAGSGPAAPASSPLPATGATSGTGSIARTGTTSDLLAPIGAAAVLLGLGAMRAGRPRVVGRARTARR
jgi:hypothetical protein